MSKFNSDLVIILNPWQVMTPAMLYSIAPEVATVPILVWDPKFQAGYFRLKKFSTQIRDTLSELEGLLPIPSAEFLKRVETRQEAFMRASLEASHAMLRLQPQRILVLADSLPTPSFWESIPKDAEIQIIRWSHDREDVERISEGSEVFRKSKDAINWIQTPIEFIVQLWEVVRQETFPQKTDVIIAGETPEEILTGLYYARKEGIPLIVARILMEEKQKTISKMTIEKGEGFQGASDKLYEPLNTVSLCDSPRFTCVLEQANTLGFVATIMYTLEQDGQIVLIQAPSEDSIGTVDFLIKEISELIISDSTDQAYQKLEILSNLVTSHIPQHVHDAINKNTDLPIQIVGTPFP